MDVEAAEDLPEESPVGENGSRSTMRRKMIRDKKGRLVDQNDIELTTTTKADEIIKMFKEQVFRSSKTGGVNQEDRGHRATKIICTLG